MKLPGSVASLALDMGCASHAGPPGLAMRQQRRLKGLLRYAQQHSPYYRDLYAGLDLDTVALQNLPTVTKTALMAAFDDWVTRPQIRLKAVQDFVQQPDLAGTPYRGDLFVCTSSGTTGHPGIFLHDAHAVAVYRAISFARINRAWLGARQWLGLAQRGLRWANIMGTGGHFGGTGWMELERQRSAWKHQAYRVVSVQRPLRDIVAELNAFTPTVVSGYASVMDQLAGEQLAGRLHLRPVLVEIAGESPTPEALPRMAAAFGCRIRNLYGASEFPFMAGSCEQGWLHVNSDWVILEPVDEKLQPVAEGVVSHTVLLTNLANRVQPIIRYDLGDAVVAHTGPCACGNRLPAIRVAGRCDDVLHMVGPNGRPIHLLPLAIGTVVEETPGCARSQLVQTGPASLRLRLSPQPGVDAAQLWRLALTHLRSYLDAQGLPNVIIEQADEPPASSAHSGKFRQVIGLRHF